MASAKAAPVLEPLSELMATTQVGLERQVSGETAKGSVDDEEIIRMDTHDLEQQAKMLREQVESKAQSGGWERQASGRTMLVRNVLEDSTSKSPAGDSQEPKKKKKLKGAFAGVFVPTCENMWGVLIFLRFYTIVGQAGVGQALCAVFLSFSCAFCTVSSMSATVSSGGVVSKGGPYYMISRALGPCVGASVGIMYWLAITMLCVLETLGAVEGILMGWPGVYFEGCRQAFGSALLVGLALFVYGGINLVTKLGLVFVLVVFFTLFIFYFGLMTAPLTPNAPPEVASNPYVSGLSMDTLRLNWDAHYSGGATFGYVLSVFFPCFTGILSGANRADILRDPPTDLRRGTFGAIIFSLFMYSSFMILWGLVAEYPYLQGEHYPPGYQPEGRRLAGAGEGAYIVDEIVYNPFPKAAVLGIIISSLSQALQCLVVSPRLLNAIAKDDILSFLSPIAPLTWGEPKRALGATYVVAAALVLIGQLDLVAPLLSMCFLVAYAFMNLSCFCLTWLKTPAWRPQGIQRKRWRLWYIITGGAGFIICLTIMFTIDPWWALIAILGQVSLYFYINWKLEAHGWGSAMDGIRFQLALKSLMQLEGSQHHHVNWRPQVLVLYRVHLAEELKGIKHHEILKFCSQLRKMNGFCMVACVLEADMRDEHAIHKAKIEKGIIQSIMKEESLQGFAEVVVAPTWAEGTNYIIQLTGIGGMTPNTVLLDWPENWRKNFKLATDFVQILRLALAEDKAVLAVRGLKDMPVDTCHGTIDIWWMIHDGGFLILLSWLLVQHRVWRSCHLRVFTITEGVTEEQAKAAAQLLTKTLRERRLFEVDVEVILIDDDMIEPYTYDWTLRVEDRHKFLEQLHGKDAKAGRGLEAIPMEVDDLFEEAERAPSKEKQQVTEDSVEKAGSIQVSDFRSSRSTGAGVDRRHSRRPSRVLRDDLPPDDDGTFQEDFNDRSNQAKATQKAAEDPLVVGVEAGAKSYANGGKKEADAAGPSSVRPPKASKPDVGAAFNELEGDVVVEQELPKANRSPRKLSTGLRLDNVDSFTKLNNIIYTRSKRAQLVVMNLPDLWGNESSEVEKFMSYCETLTKGLERVLFVHSSGHEVFDLQQR